MDHRITVDLIIRATGILWLLLAAVWLGSAPFSKPAVQRESATSRLEQGIVFFIGLYLLFAPPTHSDWFNQPAFTVTRPTALLGLALAVCGIAFSIWARLILGENWSASVTIKQGHTLIVRGPYRLVRHPIYTGILFALLGSALQRGLIRSFVAVLFCAASFWIKLTLEEQFMVQRFGGEYLNYRRHVRALVPFLF
jgi:protein-S-isoprenylcysteine O-methyltransferase Ste14